MYYIASCSCGKDSLAMVYKLMEENQPLNEIVFYDTGMEFEAIYSNWEILKQYANSKGIKVTTLYPQCSFRYTMLEKIINKGKANEHRGYAWCGGCCRWGTTEKLKALDRYCEERNAICYVGIAADESKRLEKERKSYKIFPLVGWGMTENECLKYCRNIGLNWKEKKCNDIDLYDILIRVSCWCCANKNLWELYNYWKYLKPYWEMLKELQLNIVRPFKKNYSIFDLEHKFKNGYIPKRKIRGRNNELLH